MEAVAGAQEPKGETQQEAVAEAEGKKARRGERDEEVPQRVQCDKRQKFKQNERVPMTPSFGLVGFG